ncbi:hydrolytic ATP binding site of dynein motor region D1-domain-containing protein [Tribonema minus]|uniref:Hydrolytic ATP binding site of dynein motor region D1-domain-containing protein n=1 Tax=Tribonema minus TaxID=303371 RepID=A0A835YU72_9STRA|nr:hydrolytic ATP binding site of dynein motor region D1-domain-containing protein [Tribonema minus]
MNSDGNEIKRLLQGLPDWKAYEEFVSSLVVSGLIQDLDSEYTGRCQLPPLLLVELHLLGSEVEYLPPLGTPGDPSSAHLDMQIVPATVASRGDTKQSLVASGTLRDSVQKCIDGILSAGKAFTRLDGREGSYLKEMHEDPEVCAALSRLDARLSSADASARALKRPFLDFKDLWLADLQAAFTDFMREAAYRPATTHHEWQVEGPDGTTGGVTLLHLDKFEAKIRHLLAVQDRLDVEFVRVDAQPVKQAISTWATKWLYSFTHRLQEHVSTSLLYMHSFVTEAHTTLKGFHPDSADTAGVKAALALVKKLQRATPEITRVKLELQPMKTAAAVDVQRDSAAQADEIWAVSQDFRRARPFEEPSLPLGPAMQAQEVRYMEELLDLPPTHFATISTMTADVVQAKTAWGLVQEELPPRVQDWGVCRHLKDSLAAFSIFADIMGSTRCSAMRERHWKVSDSALVELLSESAYIPALQPHLASMFPAIHALEVESPTMVAADGERVPFVRVFRAEGPAETWLTRVAARMQHAVAAAIDAAVKASAEDDAVLSFQVPGAPQGGDAQQQHWTLQHPAQAVLVAIQVAMGTYGARYSNEFIGNCERLCLTPLTDRCFLSLCMALKHQYGGAISGPVGCGKKQMAQELARMFGVPCFLLPCSPATDVGFLLDNLRGLVQSGAWGLWEGMLNLSNEVLSIMATVLRGLREAWVRLIDPQSRDQIYRSAQPGSKVGEIEVQGLTLSLVPSFALFTTLDHTARDSESFRAVAVIAPDVRLVCEALLLAEGFAEWEALTNQLLAFQSLQLGQMKALKSVSR